MLTGSIGSKKAPSPALPRWWREPYSRYLTNLKSKSSAPLRLDDQNGSFGAKKWGDRGWGFNIKIIGFTIVIKKFKNENKNLVIHG
jgi:hypothetical protein